MVKKSKDMANLFLAAKLVGGTGGGGKNGTIKLISNVPVAIIGSDSKTRVKCSFSAEVTGDYVIQEHGLLYSNNGTRTSADFTINDVDNTNVKIGRDLYSGNMLDNGTGVVARGYVKLNDQYIYTGDLGGSYADLKKPVLVTKSITENGIYSASADNADGYSQVTVDVAPPAPLSSTRSGATIYDYDGSVIATYTPEEFAALTEYPVHPTHEFLTGDGYNRSLANAKAYSAKYGYVEVGAQYRATDGKTRLFIHLEEGRLNPQLGLGINGSVDVDWGDGSAHDTMTGSDVSTTVYKAHTYAQAGDYVIALTVINGSMQFNGKYGFGYILGRSGGNQNTNRVYLNALRSIYICESVTRIGDSAFQGCSSLASITIPEGVTNIGSSAFYNCYGLASITIPESVTNIGNSSFYNCSSLASITIPESVTSISNSSFYNCSSLASITIPESVTNIGSSAFYNCYGLASITIPESVTNIGNSAFSSCYGLASIAIPESVTRIDGSAFQNCSSLASITIPEGVTSIGNGAFSNCYGLASITIPESVTRIDSSAFQNCYGLASITIPEGVTNIGNGAFSNCYGLASITIPESVTRIDSSAFSSCFGLGFIKFASQTPPTVSSISAWSSIPTDCIIYVPQGTLAAYTSATNYPDPAKYNYVEY